MAVSLPSRVTPESIMLSNFGSEGKNRYAVQLRLWIDLLGFELLILEIESDLLVGALT